MRPINEIIVHCSYTKPGMNIGADWIRKIHVEEKHFNDIGYHIIIRRDGTFENGRTIDKIGAHCYRHNRNSIGICLVGGMSTNNKPENNFTPEQFVELKQTIKFLKKLLPDINKISGHKDYSKKDCPCFNVDQLENHEEEKRFFG